MIKDKAEVFRYITNGLVATAAHYLILTFNVEVVGIQSAGLANFIAACMAICVSFLGSRYFVFRKTDEPILTQAAKFGLLYFVLALVHGGVMWTWSDHFGLDYRLGFLVATCIQVVSSFLGNKFLVFGKPK